MVFKVSCSRTQVKRRPHTLAVPELSWYTRSLVHPLLPPPRLYSIGVIHDFTTVNSYMHSYIVTVNS